MNFIGPLPSLDSDGEYRSILFEYYMYMGLVEKFRVDVANLQQENSIISVLICVCHRSQRGGGLWVVRSYTEVHTGHDQYLEMDKVYKGCKGYQDNGEANVQWNPSGP